MSLRFASSKARNHEPTLPIEDFAKGVTRLLSRRRKSASARTVKLERVAAPELPEHKLVRDLAEESLPPRRSTSFSIPNASSSSRKPPMEDWMIAVPQPKLIPARNPRRPSTSSSANSIQPSIFTACNPYRAPALDSPSMKNDWESEIDSDPATPADPSFQSRLNGLVEGSSPIRISAQPKTSDFPAGYSSLPHPDATRATDIKENTNYTQSDFSAAMMGVESMSLRSMFFGSISGSDGRPRSLSSASSKSAIPAPLSIGGSSPRPRPVSMAASLASFMTAHEFAVDEDDNEQEGDEQVMYHDAPTFENAVEDGEEDTEERYNDNDKLEEDHIAASSGQAIENNVDINEKYAAVIQELSANNAINSTKEAIINREPPLAIDTTETNIYTIDDRPISPISTTSQNHSYSADTEDNIPNSTIDTGSDTGIDEDYTSSEEEALSNDHRHTSPDLIPIPNNDSEILISTSEIPVDSLASVLLEVATSSPYASSESDSDRESESDSDSISNSDSDLLSVSISENAILDLETPPSPVSSIHSLEHVVSTTTTSTSASGVIEDNSSSSMTTVTTTTTNSLSSGSIHSARAIPRVSVSRRVVCGNRPPARHYKMINGVIVEYEPWRVDNTYTHAVVNQSEGQSSSRSQWQEQQQEQESLTQQERFWQMRRQNAEELLRSSANLDCKTPLLQQASSVRDRSFAQSGSFVQREGRWVCA